VHLEEMVRAVSRVRGWLPLTEFRMLCQEARPLVVTTRVPFVSAVQVGSSDPLEQPLTPDDHSSQRTEEEPIQMPTTTIVTLSIPALPIATST
jgi:hypothetical protein